MIYVIEYNALASPGIRHFTNNGVDKKTKSIGQGINSLTATDVNSTDSSVNKESHNGKFSFSHCSVKMQIIHKGTADAVKSSI